MARNVTTQRKIVVTVVAWTIGILIFFPILWTFLTSFKIGGRGDRLAAQSLFFFDWTTENYVEVQSRSNYFQPLHELGDHLLRLDADRPDHRHSGRLGDGVFADQAAPRTC